MYEIQAKDARGIIHSVTITQDGNTLPRTDYPSVDKNDRFIFIDRGKSGPGRRGGPCLGYLSVEGMINPHDNTVSLTFSSDEVEGHCIPQGTDYSHVHGNQYVQDSSLSADVTVPISEASGSSCSL